MSEEDWEPKKNNKPVPYQVGKYHPPKHTQFKPGQSGNPKGRKKKPVHIGATIDGLLDGKLTVKIDGKEVKISGAEALLRKAFSEALKGDHRMLKIFLQIAQQRPDATKEAPGPEVDVDRMNSSIDNLLERLQNEREEKLRAEAEAKKKGETSSE
jgi:hypothetical protein